MERCLKPGTVIRKDNGWKHTITGVALAVGKDYKYTYELDNSGTYVPLKEKTPARLPSQQGRLKIQHVNYNT